MRRDDFAQRTARLHVTALTRAKEGVNAVTDLFLKDGVLDLSDSAKRAAFEASVVDAVATAHREEALRESRESMIRAA